MKGYHDSVGDGGSRFSVLQIKDEGLNSLVREPKAVAAFRQPTNDTVFNRACLWSACLFCAGVVVSLVYLIVLV